MAANLTSGRQQTYDDGAGKRILQGLKPDIVMLQEFNFGDNSAQQLRSFVDSICGTQCDYARGNGNLPNGIVARYPIVASGGWADPGLANDNRANRDFTWARIDVPGPVDLWVVSIHLLTTSASDRRAEAQALVKLIAQHVPSTDYLLIGGDFNTNSRSEATLGILKSVVVTGGPWPTDGRGDGDTNAPRKTPYDWVVANPILAAHAIPTVIGSNTFAHGLVADTRVYTPIEELAPALARDSAAVNMQHMGVVRDFDLQVDLPPTSVRVDAPQGSEEFQIGSSQTVRWTARGITKVNVAYSIDGVNFSSIATDVDATLGAISWTIPAPATTQGLIRVSNTEGTVSDTSDGAFSTLLEVSLPKVILNEILANEAGGAVAEEFVELFNAGSASVNLSGWSIADTATVRHVFPSGTSLAAGASVVVFGNSSGIPPGLSNAIGASSGALGLGNSSDTVTLTNTAGVVIDAFSYTGSLSSVDGMSMNRSPDRLPSAPFVLHNQLSTSNASPGRAVDGAP